MTNDKIALLKSLALRPSRRIAQSVQPMVDALVEAGYISASPSGWMATPRGCAPIEQERSTHPR